MTRKFGFTLAEVLITLGIIGIVAAMTIPTLIQKHQEKTTVVKVKKMYSTLSQAYLMNKAQNEIVLGSSQSTGATAATEIAQIFIPYLKISKDCHTTETGCVFSGIYKELNGSDYARYDAGELAAYRVLLADGASVWFRRTETSNIFNNRIFYDINGSNPPNTWGKDLFYFHVVNDRVLPVSGFENACKGMGTGLGCTEWIIKVGNMDYLHCNDLSLDGKHTCD